MSRRLPSTVKELVVARTSFERSKGMRPGGLTRSSFLVGDRMYTHPRKLHTPVKGCDCVFFVSEYRGPVRRAKAERTPGRPAETFPLNVRRPFEATSLCQGGRKVTGHERFETKAQADKAVEWMAERDRQKCSRR